MTKRTCWTMCLSMAMASAWATSSARAVLVYDANADFVEDSPNPNGVWTYGYTTSLGSAFIKHLTYDEFSSNYTWHTDLSSSVPAFTFFTAAANGALAGETALHGGPGGEFAVLRFTAPAAGPYDILASWRGPGDSNNTDLYLLLNEDDASPLGSTSSTTTTGSIQVNNLLLNLGDTIDLAVGTGGDGFASDTTPVNLVITAVPETSAALAVGLAGCLAAAGRFVARRRRGRAVLAITPMSAATAPTFS